jgi:hypothetical protein
MQGLYQHVQVTTTNQIHNQGSKHEFHNYNLPAGAQAQPRGVLSYYATATLPKASSLGDWLLRIESMARQDVDAGNLPPFYRPELEIVGDPDTPLPGIPQ